MVVIEGKGTISVTEPGQETGTYYENAEIHVYGPIVHFVAYNKHKTCAATNCLIGWEAPPKIREAAGD